MSDSCESTALTIRYFREEEKYRRNSVTFKIDLVPPVAELPRPSLPGEPPPQPWVPLCGQGDSLRPEPQSTAIDVEKERTERERGRPAAEDRQTPLCTHQATTTGRGRWPISRLIPLTLGVSQGRADPGRGGRRREGVRGVSVVLAERRLCTNLPLRDLCFVTGAGTCAPRKPAAGRGRPGRGGVSSRPCV